MSGKSRKKKKFQKRKFNKVETDPCQAVIDLCVRKKLEPNSRLRVQCNYTTY